MEITINQSYAKPDEHLIVFQILYPTAAFYATELLSWGKSGKYRNELPYIKSILFVAV